ncbi:hypothetical protein RUND412_003534 [Rhizina undulata]
MPSPRRQKLIILTLIAVTLLLVYNFLSPDFFTSKDSSYLETLKKLSEKEKMALAELTQRLKSAEEEAKRKAGAKAGLKPDSPRVVEEGMKGRVDKTKEVEGATEWDPLEEIAEVLRKSPVTIFSKTYCRYSLRAKDLLLNKYHITPAPFVVELDLHEHGVELQTALEKQTGRRTVPNIMVSGKSIGGSDDIVALDRDGKLAPLIQSMGGKRIVEILREKD